MFIIIMNQVALVREEDGGRAAALDVDDVDVFSVDLDVLCVQKLKFYYQPL
jgi:hypothetical protein